MKIFVLGMHRSGTSVITGILHHLGVKLGKPLLMGAKDNPKGHFENKKFINLNQRLLQANGGRWYNPPLGRLSYHGLKSAMENFLAKFPDSQTSAFKDPRACFTFPLWRRLIDPGEKVKVIYVIRPSIEIARSLKARNQFPPEQSLKLCIKYTNAASSHVSKEEHIIVRYHDLFNQKWANVIESIATFIGINDWQDVVSAETLRLFITPDLWHHREGKK